MGRYWVSQMWNQGHFGPACEQRYGQDPSPGEPLAWQNALREIQFSPHTDTPAGEGHELEAIQRAFLL